MAVDDNTSYELTGAQVKDLAAKIKSKAADNTFTGATSAVAGVKGIVPEPQAGDNTKYLKGDGTWATVQVGSADTTFYFDSSASTIHIYKDQAMTQMANCGDIEAAFNTGRVLVVDLYGNGDEYGVIISLDTYGGGSERYFYIAGLGAYYQRSLTFNDATDTSPTYSLYRFQGSLTAGSNIQISGDTISATDTTYSAFGGATSSVAGSAGLVPQPAAGDDTKYLKGDGSWATIVPSLVEMSYGESNAWAKFITAYNAGSIVYCRASSNTNPATGTQGRKAFMAYVNNATSPTEVEFQYVRSVSSKTDSQQGDQVFIYKLTNASGGTWTVTTRNMSAKIVAGTGMSSSFTTGANATITLNAEPNYSTSEVDTKVKWINNKTIYRKTVNCGALPNATSKRVSIGASGVGQYVKIEGIAFTSNNTTISLPYVNHANVSFQIDVYIDSGDLVITAGDDKSVYTNSYITVYYTKS